MKRLLSFLYAGANPDNISKIAAEVPLIPIALLNLLGWDGKHKVGAHLKE